MSDTRIKLPITLVAIDSVYHELGRIAVEDSLRHIEPDQVVIFTDDPEKMRIPGAEYHEFSGDLSAVVQTLWYRVPYVVKSPHWIWIQWDSGVLNADVWTDEFLRHDYIGAPWPVMEGTIWHQLGYRHGRNVGNGGFALRSTRLARFLAENVDRFPAVPQEDDGICRLYRPDLEREGFTFASEELASKFSFEFGSGPDTKSPLTRGRPSEKTFGYHNCINWLWLFSAEERERRIMAAGPAMQANLAFQEMMRLHAMGGMPKQYTYDPSVFLNVATLEQAKWVIVNPDGVHTPEERWTKETDYLLQLMQEYLPIKNGRGLDYGVGIGRLAKPLIEKYEAAIIGADISPAMRQLAAGGPSGPGYVQSPRFIACDPTGLDQLNFFGLRVDFALAIWALQHFKDVKLDIGRIKRALRPGGRLFVLNGDARFVPTAEEPWVDDGVDVWAILKDAFGPPIATQTVPKDIVPEPPARWAVFEVAG